jgi:uncharacterized protein (TIGR02996 family)
MSELRLTPERYYPAAGLPPVGVVPDLHPDQRAFEERLREDPDEVAVAVYSDWCEEHGLFERAAWLRAQPPAVAVSALQRYRINQAAGKAEAVGKLVEALGHAAPAVAKVAGRVLELLLSSSPSQAPKGAPPTLPRPTPTAPEAPLGESKGTPS